MAGLLKRSRLTAFVLTLALGLSVLPGLAAPLLGDGLAKALPGVNVVLADDCENGGG